MCSAGISLVFSLTLHFTCSEFRSETVFTETFFAVIENQKEVQHNDTVKIIPCMDGALMDINPPLMTRVLPVSLYAMSNAFLVQCSANFIVSGQFLNSVLSEFPFSLLEVFWGMQ